MRPSMCQALSWWIPRSRASSWLEMPFLQLTASQIAGSHLSNPSGESSKIVPFLTEYWYLHALHFHSLRVLRYEY
jgi:hypothetical protein